MLQVNNIEVVYMNVIQVLRGVSLEVGDGKIVTLLGANGAGKTTTLKAISGLLKTEEGEVTDGSIDFDGKRLDRYGPEDIASMGICQVMEGRRVLEHLTVEENLQVGAYRRKDRGEVKRDMEVLFGYFPRLKDLRRQTSGYLSGGEQQMLVIGRALMARPKLMLLDEPSLGLAPLLVEHLMDTVREINEGFNAAIFLVEQNVKQALLVAKRAYVMKVGQIILDESTEALQKREHLWELF